VINVKCRKREDSGDVTNEIRGFSKREIAVENPIQGSSPTTPPWRRWSHQTISWRGSTRQGDAWQGGPRRGKTSCARNSNGLARFDGAW